MLVQMQVLMHSNVCRDNRWRWRQTMQMEVEVLAARCRRWW